VKSCANRMQKPKHEMFCTFSTKKQDDGERIA